MNDDECGDGCFCNGQEHKIYFTGAKLQVLLLGAAFPGGDGLGVCGERFRAPGDNFWDPFPVNALGGK